MTLRSEVEEQVANIFKEQWKTRDGQVVPESEDLRLANDAVKLSATVLYADLASSTSLVDGYKPHFAAEIYKAFLYGAAKIIRLFSGVITGYDGDRIMAVYIGDSKNSNAAKTALKINSLVRDILNPAIRNQYSSSKYYLKHVVGVDTSELFIARTGIRGSNDLVWVGRAANYAAKLSALSPEYPSRITKSVYDLLNDSAKYHEGTSMWTAASWTSMGNMTIYQSNWKWGL